MKSKFLYFSGYVFFSSLLLVSAIRLFGDADDPVVRGQKDRELCEEYCAGANSILESISSNPYDAQHTTCTCFAAEDD